MPSCTWKPQTGFRFLAVGLTLIATAATIAYAGHNNGFNRNNAVGGVLIDASGVVAQPPSNKKAELLTRLRERTQAPPEDLNAPVALRRISLRGLEAALAEGIKRDYKIPNEVQYLAGLQRIQYVFVYPELNDIVLAGPAEGWVINEEGPAPSVVGVTTGRPVLQVDDLLAAFRSVHAARQQGISVSIDPTEEGYRNLNAVLQKWSNNRGRINTKVLEAEMKKAFGPQKISINGISGKTHLARVLVTADYRMKRFAMNLEKSPVPGMTSFMQMISKTPQDLSSNPRWWLACNYEPLACSADKLAWELRGPGVKVLTEDDLVDAQGQVQGSGRKNAAAQKWADNMTAHYEELAAKDEVFGQLRNVMDMCVVAALIEKEGLLQEAGCSIPLITSDDGYQTYEFFEPKTVDPQVSFLRSRGGLHVSASGGVDIDSWGVVSRVETVPEVGNLRAKPTGENATWWWN